MPPLGLPPVTSELKSISPFLQRADELVRKEPVISYWCAYHAAQIGISMKAKDNASRTLLFQLLGVLEKLKADIGPNDAVDVEAASIAYVENFALKIFRLADDEDREGMATRSTAKKFLAAANFFELLKVFPKADQSEAIEGKIKYAKWKAADIAKAFREGRKPAPGPPGSRTDLTATPPPVEEAKVDVTVSSPSVDPFAPSPRTSPRISPKRTTPPPQMTPDDILKANQSHTPSLLQPVAPDTEDDSGISPGRWSTAATPGYDEAETPLTGARTNGIDISSNHTRRSSSGQKARVSWEMEGTPGQDNTTTSGSPREGRYFPTAGAASNGHAPSVPVFSSLNSRSDPMVPAVPPSPPSTSASVPTVSSFKKSPSSMRGGELGGPSLPSPSAPPLSPPQSPRRPDNMHPSPPQTSLPEAGSPVGFILTPAIIAKTQKHCRFAISSLDYEDAEQARRELRAALAALGG